MERAQIEVAASTRDAIMAARVDLFGDAGQVLTADGRLLFLLGVWRAVRHTADGAEACRIVGENMARAGVGADRRCRA